MARLTLNLYKLARTVNTVSALTSGSSRVGGRIAVGRLLARAGVWRRLWGGR